MSYDLVCKSPKTCCSIRKKRKQKKKERDHWLHLQLPNCLGTFSKNSFVFTISTNVCLQLWSKWTNYLLSGTGKSSLWRWKINKIWTIMNLLNSRLVKCSFLCFIYLLKKTKKFWIKIKLSFKNQNKTWSWFNALSATNFL